MMHGSTQNIAPITIPYGRQSVSEDDIAAVVDVLRSDYLTTGPAVGLFEGRFAAYVGSKYAVAVNSGTSALHAAMLAVGVGPGTDVIATPMSFAATANCILHAGGTPVFVDIEAVSMNIDPEKIEERIARDYARRGGELVNTATGSVLKAVCVVHFAGLPCAMDTIADLAARHGLRVVEDAAHALGAQYAGPSGGRVGSIPGHVACFSTHPVKHITTGEGGVVTCSDPQTCRRVKEFRNHGITTLPQDRVSQDDPWHYEMVRLGFNYRLSDIHAALGAAQLARADHFLQRREEIAERYLAAFAGRDDLQPPRVAGSGSRHAWHLFVVRLAGDRGRFVRRMRERGVGVNVHYIPIHLHPYYRERFGYDKGSFPVAEEVYRRAATLPLHPSMTDEEVEYVIRATQEILDKDRAAAV